MISVTLFASVKKEFGDVPLIPRIQEVPGDRDSRDHPTERDRMWCHTACYAFLLKVLQTLVWLKWLYLTKIYKVNNCSFTLGPSLPSLPSFPSLPSLPSFPLSRGAIFFAKSSSHTGLNSNGFASWDFFDRDITSLKESLKLLTTHFEAPSFLIVFCDCLTSLKVKGRSRQMWES